MSTTPPLPEWRSVVEAARHLGLSPKTVRKLIEADELRAYRFGRVVRINLDDINAYIKNSTYKKRPRT